MPTNLWQPARAPETKQRGQAQFCVCGHAGALPYSKLFRAARATPAAAVAVPAIWPGAAMSRCFGLWRHTERSDLASEGGSRRRFVAKCDTSQSQSHKILHLAATVGPTSHTVRACPASFSCLRARRESPAHGLKIKRLSHIKLYGVATASRCFQAALLRKRLARVELGGTGMT